MSAIQYSCIVGLKYIDLYAYALFISAVFGSIRANYICKISKDLDYFDKRILEMVNYSSYIQGFQIECFCFGIYVLWYAYS